MSLDRISAVIITRNAAGTLATTLDALSGFPEVVVFDNGSTDDTLEVAGGFDNVRIVQGRFEGFGPTRNQAAEYASHDWIFSIDADERPDVTLLRSLETAGLDDAARVYAVHRENWMMGRPVRVGGWGGDWPRRLYHRRHTGFSDAAVHESLLVPDNRVLRLDGLLVHRAVEDLGDFLDKVRRYSALRAPAKQPVHPLFIVLRSAWAFLRSYCLQLGFTAGWRGLAIAWSNANGVFYKYLRAWARHRRDEETRGERR